MNWKTWVPLVLAIVLGVVAAKLVKDTIAKNRGNAGPTAKTTKIVVAKADIKPGAQLRADDLETKEVDTASLPDAPLTEPEKLTGRVAQTLMLKNQPVVEAMLEPDGSGSGIQSTIPEGMRAITMEVNEFSAVAGLITPNCRVDILSTLTKGKDNEQVAKTIVQNIKVTAVGQKTSVNANEPPQPGEGMFRSVTMLVTPEQAEQIELATSIGRPRLVLRTGKDDKIVETAGVTMNELRGDAADGRDPFDLALLPSTQPAVAATTQPSEAVAERPKRVIRLIRGGLETNVTLNVMDGPDSGAIGTIDPFEQK